MVAARKCKGCGRPGGCDAYQFNAYWHFRCLLRERRLMAERRLPGRPALQNIPIRTELGKELRRQFLTEDKLKGVDYSKIEMELAEQLKKEKS